MRARLIRLVAAVAAIAIMIKMILRLPGLPYNVSGLFLDHGSALAIVIFAVALIWVGAAPMLLARWMARSQRPYVVLLVGVVIASMVSRTLLKYSVTYESLDDILGTNNLFWQVTVQNIWGEFWRHAFLVANVPDLVTYFERRICYIALYSPLAMCLALAMLPIARASGRRVATSWFQLWWLALSVVAWLWLSKIITFTWAATDNLTELIAQRGPFGLGGGSFLYLIVVLVAADVALLVRATDRWTWWPAAIAFSIVAIQVGWLLLGAGLEQHVERHGPVFLRNTVSARPGSSALPQRYDAVHTMDWCTGRRDNRDVHRGLDCACRRARAKPASAAAGYRCRLRDVVSESSRVFRPLAVSVTNLG